MSRLAVTRDPLTVEPLVRLLETDAQARGEGCGAVSAFVGVVRATHGGRRVRHIEYEAFEPLALKAFAQIADEVARQWARATVAIHHRVGRLEVGEASVVVVAATAHRAEAFQACRYAIERVKQIAPVWKHEFFEDGHAWVEGASVAPDDEQARLEARARACV